MATRDEYRSQTVEQRLQRLGRTPDDLARAIQGQTDDALSRRPDERNWSAKEVICHLRDIEELFMLRFHTMLGTDEPTFLTLGDMPPHPERWGIGGRIGMPLDPARLAEDRQYRRHDTVLALSSLRARREEFAAPASARALLPEVIRWVSGYFDRPLVLNGAIVDAQDQQVHAFFETVHHGQAVRGTLAVFAGGGRGSALLLFDRPDRFAQSSGPMLQQMMGGGGERAGRPAAPPRVEPLRQAVFPDGSGAIGLPEGWAITSYRNATVEAYGQGGNIALGVRYTVPVNPSER